MGERGTKRVLEYARLAMGFANVRAGTRVLTLVLVLVQPDRKSHGDRSDRNPYDEPYYRRHYLVDDDTQHVLHRLVQPTKPRHSTRILG